MCISAWILRNQYLIAIIAILGSACDTGWFGSNCQYKCHCSSDSCDGRGECTTGNVCARGWFGPACQYQDLLSIPGTIATPTSALITDRDDITCFTSDVNNLTINFLMTYPITWIRLNVLRSDLIKSIALVSADNRGIDQSCNLWSRVDDRTMDLFCHDGVIVQELVFHGSGVKSLCSLYISGGRSVALRQSATQSSTYNDATYPETTSKANNAVDGNTSGNFTDGSCTHTLASDTAPNWNVTFSAPQLINRYVLYNRNSNQERLLGVQLSSLNADGNTVFSYSVPNVTQASYSVIAPTYPVAFIRIFKALGSIFLTLCEVEVYGDSVCPHWTYGLECDKSCNCENKAETCFVATGGCPSGCAAGFYGDGCDISCPALRWGPNCLSQCSVLCLNQSCYPNNGSCVYGCVPGYEGIHCVDACPLRRWGQDCKKSCSDQCQDQTCNRFTGVCESSSDDQFAGVNGTQGCSCDDRFGMGFGIGIAASCVVGLVIAGIIFCIFKRRHQNCKQDVPDSNRVNVNKGPQSLPMNTYDTLNAYDSNGYDKPIGLNVTKETSTTDVSEAELSHYYELPDSGCIHFET